MKIIRCDQRGDQWKTMRLGRVSASNAYKILTPDGKPSRQARKYMHGLIYERLVGEPPFDDDKTYIRAVREGIEREPDARREFQILTELRVEQIGLAMTDDAKLACSPDGIIVGRNEAVEIKCPQGDTQIGYLLDGLEDNYKPQVQCQMLIGGWDKVHFYSYHPNTPAFYKITERDPVYQHLLAQALREFVAQLDVETEIARSKGPFFRVAPLWVQEE